MMARVIICDDCGETQDRNSNDFYDVSRYGEEKHETANLCPDCLPDSIKELLNVEEVESGL